MGSFRRALLILFSLSGAAGAAEVVRDEAVRMEALRSLFPTAVRIFDTARKIDLTLHPGNQISPFRLDDSLHEESVYVVSGRVEPHEVCAAGKAAKGTQSAVRRVRFRLFQLTPSRYLAAVNYQFADSRPPRECYRIGRVILLNREGGKWSQADAHGVTKPGFRMFTRLQLEDLNGDGVDELLLDWNWSGEGAAGTEFELFSVREGRFHLRFSTFSQTFLYGEEADEVIQVFDLAKTVAAKGARIFFRRATFVRKNERLPEPEVEEISMPLPAL